DSGTRRARSEGHAALAGRGPAKGVTAAGRVSSAGRRAHARWPALWRAGAAAATMSAFATRLPLHCAGHDPGRPAPGTSRRRPLPHVFRRADTARNLRQAVKPLPATRIWMVPGKPVEGIASMSVPPRGARHGEPRLSRSSIHMTFETTPFDGLGLSPALLRALSESGYTTPTPIQAQAIPPALAGRDLLGAAQTGTGKTAAFGLPLLQKLARETPARGPRKPRAL